MSTYTSPGEISPLTKALSGQINDLDSAIEAGFDALPDEDDLYRGNVVYGTSGGAADVYTYTSKKTQTAYVDGMEVVLKAPAANTGTSATINVDGLGAKSIVRRDGALIAAGEIPKDKFTVMRYNSDSGFFEIQNPPNNGGGSGTITIEDSDSHLADIFMLGGF